MMKIGRSELVALASDIYEGNNLNGYLRDAKKSCRKKVADRLWDDLKEKYPERDFTLGDEPKARSRIIQNLEPVLKCKLVYLIDQGAKWVFRQAARTS